MGRTRGEDMLEDACDHAVACEQKLRFIAKALRDPEGHNDGVCLVLLDVAAEIGQVADSLNQVTSARVATCSPGDEPQDQSSNVH